MSIVAEREMIEKLKNDFKKVASLTEQIRLGNYDMKSGISQLDEILNIDIRYMEDRLVEITNFEAEILRLNNLVNDINKVSDYDGGFTGTRSFSLDETREKGMNSFGVDNCKHEVSDSYVSGEIKEFRCYSLDEMLEKGMVTLEPNEVLEVDTDKWEIKFVLKKQP